MQTELIVNPLTTDPDIVAHVLGEGDPDIAAKQLRPMWQSNTGRQIMQLAADLGHPVTPPILPEPQNIWKQACRLFFMQDASYTTKEAAIVIQWTPKARTNWGQSLQRRRFQYFSRYIFSCLGPGYVCAATTTF